MSPFLLSVFLSPRLSLLRKFLLFPFLSPFWFGRPSLLRKFLLFPFLSPRLSLLRKFLLFPFLSPRLSLLRKPLLSPFLSPFWFGRLSLREFLLSELPFFCALPRFAPELSFFTFLLSFPPLELFCGKYSSETCDFLSAVSFTGSFVISFFGVLFSVIFASFAFSFFGFDALPAAPLLCPNFPRTFATSSSLRPLIVLYVLLLLSSKSAISFVVIFNSFANS